MTTDTTDLVALLGSRICHDLISPLGAIGNGVELLMMSGTAPGPEMALISESVANANARIRFFRIAFGAASQGQSVSLSEIRSILDDITRGGRLRIDWLASGEMPRTDVKLAFLALQCLETAMPVGGLVRVTAEDGRWQIRAEAAKLRVAPELWKRLREGGYGDVTPAQVQFALLSVELARAGLRLTLQIGEHNIELVF